MKNVSLKAPLFSVVMIKPQTLSHMELNKNCLRGGKRKKKNKTT